MGPVPRWAGLQMDQVQNGSGSMLASANLGPGPNLRPGPNLGPGRGHGLKLGLGQLPIFRPGAGTEQAQIHLGLDRSQMHLDQAQMHLGQDLTGSELEMDQVHRKGPLIRGRATYSYQNYWRGFVPPDKNVCVWLMCLAHLVHF